MATLSIPQYEQIKRRLIQEIRAGRWPAGSVFPSENQLLTRYKVSRATLVRSLQDLVREGYLYRRQGQGTFVADRKGLPATVVPIFMSAMIGRFSGPARLVLMHILTGLQNALEPSGAGVSLRQIISDELDEATKTVIDQTQPSIAIVVESATTPDLLEYLARRNCQVWTLNTPVENSNCVYIDQERAGYLATRHLIQAGRRKIALLNGPVRSYWGFAARLRGYERALGEAGIDVDPRHVLEGASAIDSEAGRTMMRAILSQQIDIDAVVGASDSKAMGAMAAAKEAGRRVPEEISFVSIDNTIAPDADPPLTAVSMPFEEVGRQAGLAIAEALRTGTVAVDRHICLQPKLVARESVKFNGEDKASEGSTITSTVTQ